jgi:hypothetical protein
MLDRQLSRKATYLEAFWALYLHAAWTEFQLTVYILCGGLENIEKKYSLHKRQKNNHGNQKQ